ncbi:copper resistance CopC family protein [Egibacter rhizosphaerae]|uniref:copper resistance CopC family protein n=1 Tax=Egibacter rhizosphaerae TaxID=1670831 RepID=UPI0013F1720D|nr:copper resistance CopC family protein [Egibacter rhizosphaerae]
MTAATLVTVPLALLATLVLLAWWAGPAGAHAALLESQPDEGEEIEGGPDVLVLVFNEDIDEPAIIEVTDPAGEEVTDPDAEIDGAEARLDLVDVLAEDGTYEVAWRVVSVDDHSVEGEFSFEAVNVADDEAADDEDDEESDSEVAATDDEGAEDAATDEDLSDDDADEDEHAHDEGAEDEDAEDESTDDDLAALDDADETAAEGGTTTAWVVGLVIVLGLAALAGGLVLGRRRGADR